LFTIVIEVDIYLLDFYTYTHIHRKSESAKRMMLEKMSAFAISDKLLARPQSIELDNVEESEVNINKMEVGSTNYKR
jgi:hypothetical protein